MSEDKTEMQAVFQRSDFTLCHVPVTKGYPQSQTHCGVALIGDRVLMTTSPYPAVKYKRVVSYGRKLIKTISLGKLFSSPAAETFENPFLYISEKNKGNIPVKFTLLQQRPLLEAPEPYYGLPSYNSDPDIFVEGDAIYITCRRVYRMHGNDGKIINRVFVYLISGLLDEDRFKWGKTELLSESDFSFISPCLIKYKKDYILSELETNVYNDGKTFDGLFLYKSEKLDKHLTEKKREKICVNSDEFTPWHMSLFLHNDKLYTVVACVQKGQSHRCWQMLGEFNEDLTRLTIYQKPLSDYRAYRGSAMITNSGEFVLYNTTVFEKVRGSKAVDGRNVVMAHMPFNELLEILKR